jgi:hypothetical protein
LVLQQWHRQADGRYACVLCPATFTLKNNLQRHRKQHLGVHPYPCPCCGKGYTSRLNLHKHLNNYHREYARLHGLLGEMGMPQEQQQKQQHHAQQPQQGQQQQQQQQQLEQQQQLD